MATIYYKKPKTTCRRFEQPVVVVVFTHTLFAVDFSVACFRNLARAHRCGGRVHLLAAEVDNSLSDVYLKKKKKIEYDRKNRDLQEKHSSYGVGFYWI